METAIVLISFMVVFAVFGFAALSIGPFSSDKAKETIQADLAETRGSMELKVSVILEADGTSTATSAATIITFQVANGAGGNSICLTPEKTLIKYPDQTQSKMFLTDSSSNGFTASGLEPGRLASYRVNTTTGNLEPLEVYRLEKAPMWVLITEL